MEEKLLDQEVGVIVALSGVKFELSGAREDTGNGRDGVCPEERVLEWGAAQEGEFDVKCVGDDGVHVAAFIVESVHYSGSGSAEPPAMETPPSHN